MKDESQKKHTRISLHSVKNILGNQEQLSLFSEHHREFAEEFQIELFNNIHKFGIDLSDVQLKVMEGILRGFSETGYRGNLDPKNKEEISVEKFSGKIPDSYKYIKEIPVLKASQSEVLDWAGVNKNSIASKTRALEALSDLGASQFCFYYDRLAYSENGEPLKERDGSWKKETVTSVDTLFSIKKVYEKGGDVLSYYEIIPSSIFLDQIDGFFLLIPYKWREEVRKLFGNKKASAYTFRFLLFLRYQYELRRRSARVSSPYQLKWSPEEIAIAIKMPRSVHSRKKARMNEILDDAYFVAKQLGYLKDFSRKGYIDVLTFNDQKYSLNQTFKADKVQESSSIAEEILEHFVQSRKSLDPALECPEGSEKNAYLKEFSELSKTRLKEDVKKLITWSVTQPYWVSRLSTPAKIRKSFSEAWIEFSVQKTTSKETRFQENKDFSTKKLLDIHRKCEAKTIFREGECKLSLQNGGVEFSSGSHYTFIEFEDSKFLEKLRSSLKKYQLSDVEI